MTELVNFLSDNWAALTAAPGAFVALAILAFGATFLVARWRYEGIGELLRTKISLMEARLDTKGDQLDDYRERLHLISASSTAFSRLSNAELQRRAIDVVAKIRTFLAERGDRNRSLLFAHGVGVTEASSEEERQRAWENESNALMRDLFETAADFDTRYKVDTILLRDELLSRLPSGSKKEREFGRYEHPTNPIGMGMVTDDLERLAKSLPVNAISEGA